MSKEQTKYCPDCNEWLDISEFGSNKNNDDGLAFYCKKHYNERRYASRDIGAMKALEKLLELGIIKNSEISSARTLYLSCDSRIKSCRYGIGIYKNIKCDWESPFVFMVDIIQQLPSVWQDWKIQNAIYEEDGNGTERPTIDRKNSKGNYTITNIQMLSKRDNTQKATEHMQAAMIFRETETSRDVIGLELFSSKIELAERLGINENLIYKAKAGEVVQFDDIIIQFQDVIKKTPTKEEVLNQLNHYAERIEYFEKLGWTEQRDKNKRFYDSWRDTAVSRGYIVGVNV